MGVAVRYIDMTWYVSIGLKNNCRKPHNHRVYFIRAHAHVFIHSSKPSMPTRIEKVAIIVISGKGQRQRNSMAHCQVLG